MKFITTFLELRKGQYLSIFKVCDNLQPKLGVDFIYWEANKN